MSRLGNLLQRLKSEDWVADAVERAHSPHRTGRTERWDDPDLHVHPSSAGAACPRDAQLGMLGYHDEMKPQNFRRVSNGTRAHERWTEDLAAAGILADHDVKYKGPIDLPWYTGLWSGTLDVYLQKPIDLSYHVAELKTMNSHKFRTIPVQVPDFAEMALLMERFTPGYTYQLCQYMAVFSATWALELERVDSRRQGTKLKLPGPPASVGMLVFENTDTQDFAVRYIQPNSKLVDRAFANQRLAVEASLRGELIAPPFRRTSPTCRKCYKEKVCYLLQDEDPTVVEMVQQRLEVTRG